jgi:hypothetical protein
MIYDTNTEQFMDALLNREHLPEMTPDGQYYYQLTEEGFVTIHKDHPLMKMTDDEFVASLDDPWYDFIAEVTYAAATAAIRG